MTAEGTVGAPTCFLNVLLMLFWVERLKWATILIDKPRSGDQSVKTTTNVCSDEKNNEEK
jgi:hypothetical protein